MCDAIDVFICRGCRRPLRAAFIIPALSRLLFPVRAIRARSSDRVSKKEAHFFQTPSSAGGIGNKSWSEIPRERDQRVRLEIISRTAAAHLLRPARYARDEKLPKEVFIGEKSERAFHREEFNARVFWQLARITLCARSLLRRRNTTECWRRENRDKTGRCKTRGCSTRIFSETAWRRASRKDTRQVRV